jgi:hypothetical protein
MKPPKATAEDPQAKLAREAEQQRADAGYVTNEQDLLAEEMRKRTRRFGSRMALAGTPASALGGSGPSFGGGTGPANGGPFGQARY